MIRPTTACSPVRYMLQKAIEIYFFNRKASAYKTNCAYSNSKNKKMLSHHSRLCVANGSGKNWASMRRVFIAGYTDHQLYATQVYKKKLTFKNKRDDVTRHADNNFILSSIYNGHSNVTSTVEGLFSRKDWFVNL